MRFVDFDGTLVDLWPRYHAVFTDLTGLKINVEQYKTVKQKLLSDELVAKFFNLVLPDDYFSKKKVLLEEKCYLEKDKLLFSKQQIRDIFSVPETIILTKRRNVINTKWELRNLDLDVPVKVLQDGSKHEWIQKQYGQKDIIVVGDSLADLETGYGIFVRNGMVGYGLGTKIQFDSMGIIYDYLKTPCEMFTFLQRNILK